MKRRQQVRNCAAVDCFSLADVRGFLCAHHGAMLPAANQDELRTTFDAWKQKTGPRTNYLAARIRAILDIADLEQRTAPGILYGILEALEETNELEREA